MEPSRSSLSALFTHFGSDKNTDHSYGPFYDDLAKTLLHCGKHLHLMEIGVDRGYSIKALHAFFGDQATLYGVDLHVDSIQSIGPGVQALITDQSKTESVIELRQTFQTSGIFLDLIIDDASHAREDQLRTAQTLWPILAPGGHFVIEDVQHPESTELFAHFPGFQVIDLRSVKNRCDDMLVVMCKPTLI